MKSFNFDTNRIFHVKKLSLCNWFFVIWGLNENSVVEMKKFLLKISVQLIIIK